MTCYQIRSQYIKTNQHISNYVTSNRFSSRHIRWHDRHIISYRIISRHIASHHIISYHITSYPITSNHMIRQTSYHITSHEMTWYHILSYYVISYYIISYHTISYHLYADLEFGSINAIINGTLFLIMSVYIKLFW